MARTILIENTTGSTKTWVGQRLDAAETFDIPEARMFKWANDATVITDVASGDLKVIKSEGPTVYYTAAEGQRVLDGISTSVAAGGSSGELLCSNPTGDLVWTPVVGGTVIFFSNGSTGDKWLKTFEGEAGTSDVAPMIMPFDAIVYALSFINKVNSKSGDFEIYKNGSLLFTWNIVTKRWAYKTDGLTAITFSAGDRMSAFFGATGANPDDPMISVHYSFLNGVTGSGGAATGV